MCTGSLFGMEVSWDDGHPPTLTAVVPQLPWQPE